MNISIKSLNAEPINQPSEGPEEDLLVCPVSFSVALDFSFMRCLRCWWRALNGELRLDLLYNFPSKPLLGGI